MTMTTTMVMVLRTMKKSMKMTKMTKTKMMKTKMRRKKMKMDTRFTKTVTV